MMLSTPNTILLLAMGLLLVLAHTKWPSRIAEWWRDRDADEDAADSDTEDDDDDS